MHVDVHGDSSAHSVSNRHIHLHIGWLIHGIVGWRWHVHGVRTHVDVDVHGVGVQSWHGEVHGRHDLGLPVGRRTKLIVERNERVYQNWLTDYWQIRAASANSRQTGLNNKEVNRMQSVSPGSWLDILRMTARSSIDNFDHILSLSLLSCRQPRETSLEYYIIKSFLMTIRTGVRNLIP